MKKQLDIFEKNLCKFDKKFDKKFESLNQDYSLAPQS